MNGSLDTAEREWVVGQTIPLQDATGTYEFDYRVLFQDTYWLDRNRTVLLISEMSPDYVFNVREFIVEIQPEFYRPALLSEYANKLMASLSSPGSVECSMQRMREIAQQDTNTLLRNTPLVRKLESIVEPPPV
jgi:hypothetical protein